MHGATHVTVQPRYEAAFDEKSFSSWSTHVRGPRRLNYKFAHAGPIAHSEAAKRMEPHTIRFRHGFILIPESCLEHDTARRVLSRFARFSIPGLNDFSRFNEEIGHSQSG